jgi:hypothetical protein
VIRCICHVLNLCIKSAFLEANAADAFHLIQIVRSFVAKANVSPNMLRELASMHEGTMPSLLDYAETRWIGVFSCLDRFVHLRHTIERYCQIHMNDWRGLTLSLEDQRQWDALTLIRDLLFPVAMLSQSLQGEKYPTLSLSVQLFFYLKSQIMLPHFSNQESRAFTSFRKALLAQLKNRFPAGFWTDHHLIAAQLDPRVRWITSLGWTNQESEDIRTRGHAALAAKYAEVGALAAQEQAAPAPVAAAAEVDEADGMVVETVLIPLLNSSELSVSVKSRSR